MTNVCIKSLGYHIPRGRLTNEEVLARIREANRKSMSTEDLDLLVYGNGRKFEFLGIETRSYCENLDEENTVTMAKNAIASALDGSGMKAGQIDCLIATGVSNPFREPSLALILAAGLDGFRGDFFDINDTCNGFMKSIDVATQFIRSGKYAHVLVATSENPYELAEGFGIDYSLPGISDADNRFSALLAGCGAAAAVLCANGEQGRIVNYAEKRETLGWSASVLTAAGVRLPGSASCPVSPGVWTDARLVSAQVIKDLPLFVRSTIEQWHMRLDDFGLLVLHQLGNNVTFATLESLGVSRNKAPVNTFREYGNMASANLPVNLAIAVERGYVTTGTPVLLLSSACGLSYSLTHVQW
jgi:3-oxoacyl-[acyl-carrier-protein] synthase III